MLLGRRYNRAKKQGTRTDLTSGQSGHKSSTAEHLADQHGVSPRSVKRAGAFAKAVDKARDWYDQQAKERQRAGLKRGAEKPVQEPVPERKGQARDAVGEVFGVSGRTVDLARTAFPCPVGRPAARVALWADSVALAGTWRISLDRFGTVDMLMDVMNYQSHRTNLYRRGHAPIPGMLMCAGGYRQRPCRSDRRMTRRASACPERGGTSCHSTRESTWTICWTG